MRTVLRDLLHNIMPTSIHITGVPKGQKKKKRMENIFEDIIAKKFPNLGKETDIQVQEAQGDPYRINPKKNPPRHFQMANIKEKI